MSISVIVAALAGLFALISMIVSIVVLVKLGALSHGSPQELEDMIENELSGQRREMNQRLDSVTHIVSEGINDGFSRIMRAEADNMQNVRETMNERLGSFERTMTTNNTALDKRMEEMRKSQEDKLDAVRETTSKSLADMSEKNTLTLKDGMENVGSSVTESLNKIIGTLNDRLETFEKTVSANNEALDKRMEAMRKSQEDKLDAVRETTSKSLTDMSDKSTATLKAGMENVGSSVTGSLDKVIGKLNDRLETFEKTVSANNEALDKRMEAMRKSQEDSLEKVRITTERQLTTLREANQRKLDEIEGTVAEKLDKTLSERVSESFKNVSDQLEKVYKGLGEMQSLASDVGSLKNALTNVKVRGEMGEIQLARILEQTLAAEQYDENVITKKGSKDSVEFAIKIPSKELENKFIYLPVDAKFPLDTYSALCEAYESGDKAKIDAARKALYTRVKTDAANINDKYISVPDTTDFGIMFLPTEGLFAEIIRNAELTEKLRMDYKVTVCGPSTITAFLNSLQMGFRTLTYEKKSGQIARTLSEVKTEFVKFGDSLSKVQKNIDATGKELDNLVGRRTRAINRKLNSIEELPSGESNKYLTFDDE